jgi:putative heme-binding domain-containing protein
MKSPGDPAPLVTAFLSRSGGAEALGEALKDLPPDSARLALRVMGALGREDRPLWDILQKASGLSGGPLAYSPGLVKQLGEEARGQGNPEAGERVFRAAMTNCVSCHAIGGAGGQVGPELGEVGTALPIDMLIESVLWPNRQVKENFTSTLVATDDGRLIQGYKVREDAESLVLRDPVADRVLTIPVKRIEKRKDVGSVMPEGVVQGLTRAELRDLVRFLAELGRPGPWQVSHRPLVRTWRVLDAKGGWTVRVSTVSGKLPATDVPKAEEGRFGRARFAYEVTRPGRFRLDASGAESVWVNGRRVEGPEVDFAAGRQEIVLRVDVASVPALSCEVTPAPGAEGRLLADR